MSTSLRKDGGDGAPEPHVNPAIKFSVSRYVLSIGVFVAVVLFGLVSTFRLGVDLLPSFEIPIVAVSTTYAGAAPESVDRDLSRKIEDAVSTISGVTDITSTSASSQSTVIISFQDGTNIDAASNAVSQAINANRGSLPSDADAPVVQKFDPNAQPIMTLALLAGGQRLSDVTSYANDTLIPKLQRVDGVADITLSGGQDREIQVLLDPARLQSYNLTPARVTAALQAVSSDLPAGSITQNGNDISLTTRTVPRTTGDVENVVVDSASGVRVVDVATVRDSAVAPTSYSRLNGQPAVLLSIRKASGTNSVAVADNVRATAAALNLPSGYKLIASDDTTRSTKASVSDTYRELGIAILAVGVVVLLFLGRLNTVFAVILAIPISISAAPLLYGLFGFTLNIISLLAIIVAMGIVVDDSIVVAENVQRYRDRGVGLVKSVLLGGSEVFSAVTAASFSLLAVLIPLSFMPGIIGGFFRQFGLGLAAAIFLSWLEALLFLTVRMAYTPDPKPLDWRGFGRVLGSFVPTMRWALRVFYKPWGLVGLVVFALVLFAVSRQAGPLAFVGLILYPILLGLVRYLLMVLIGLLEAVTFTLSGATDWVVVRVQNAYARSIARVVRYGGWVILIAVVFLASVVVPFASGRVGFTFTPKSDDGVINVTYTLPTGSDLDRSNALAARAESVLLAQKDVRLLSTTVDQGSVNFTATLIPKAERRSVDELVEVYRAKLAPIAAGVAGTNLVVGAQQNGPGGSSDLSLALSATDQGELTAREPRVVAALRADPNIASVTSSLSNRRAERAFVPNNAALAGSGLTPSDVAQALRTYNDGSKAGKLRTGNKDLDIVVRLNPTDVQNQNSLLSQTVYSQQLGGNVPIGQFGRFEIRTSPSTINRINKAYTSTLDINLKPGVNAFAYQQTIEQNLKARGLLGDNVTLGNASSFGTSQLTGDLLFYGPVVLIVALLLNYLVLGAQFNSFRYPIYLLIPVPLAIVGGVWALDIFHTSLDVITVLGMVILIGLSTKNAILYLEFVVDRLKVMPLYEALVESARLRFRPIIMTTLTVIVISVPLILGQGEGAEFRRGLGIVILGGVVTSTLLTFYVVPSVFYLFERRRVAKQQADRPRGGGVVPATD